MSAKLKPQPITTKLQFTATLDEAAALQLDIETRTAALNERMAALELEEKAAIARLEEQLNAKLVLAEAFAIDHRDELLTGELKSAQTARAKWGFRLNPPSLKQLNKTWSVARSLQAIVEGYHALKKKYNDLKEKDPADARLADLLTESEKMRAMVKVTESLNKDVIKEAWKDEPEKLKAHGFKLEAEDEFWVEPIRAVEAAVGN